MTTVPYRGTHQRDYQINQAHRQDLLAHVETSGAYCFLGAFLWRPLEI